MVPGLYTTSGAVVALEDMMMAAAVLKRPHSSPLIQKSRKRPRKAVGFCEKPVIIQDAPQQEQQSTWYSLEEYSHFEEDVRSTIKRIRTSETTSSITCIRGLEKYRTVQHHEEKKLREHYHNVAILREQTRQRISGIDEPHLFHVLSKINSKWARDKALAAAQRDAQEAREYFQSNSKTVIALTLGE